MPSAPSMSKKQECRQACNTVYDVVHVGYKIVMIIISNSKLIVLANYLVAETPSVIGSRGVVRSGLGLNLAPQLGLQVEHPPSLKVP